MLQKNRIYAFWKWEMGFNASRMLYFQIFIKFYMCHGNPNMLILCIFSAFNHNFSLFEIYLRYILKLKYGFKITKLGFLTRDKLKIE